MLDSVLVEHVMGIHRQRQSGVLNVSGALTTMRFAFQNGDPVAIDFGRAKDLLLADTLLAYHRLNETQHTEAIAHFGAGLGSILQFVTSRRYATPQEVALATQGMVEDTLCQCFSTGQLTITFAEGEGTETFEFAKQAMRLKIPADLLLRTTSARVAENLSLSEEFGDFTGIYALTETVVESAALTDAEKRVLNVVDGRANLREIAVAARDSDLNVARIVRALANKKIIKRHQSTTKFINSNTTVSLPPNTVPATATASAATAGAATAGQRGPAPVLENFTPYRTVEQPQGGGRATTYVLSAVLLTMFGVGALVLRSMEHQKEIREATERFAEMLQRNDWTGALAQIETARVKAGADLEALQRVAQLEKLVNDSVATEAKAIRKLMAVGDYPTARSRWSHLPPGNPTDLLRIEIDNSQASFEERRRTVAVEIQKLLADNQVEEALKILKDDSRGPRLLELGVRELEQWQTGLVDSVQGVTTPLWRRLELVALVRRSQPGPRLVKMIETAEMAIAERQAQIKSKLPLLAVRISSGTEMLGLLAEIDRLRSEAAKLPVESELTALRSEIETVKATTDEFMDKVVIAVRGIDNPERLAAALALSENLVPTGSIPPDNLIGLLATVVRDVVDSAKLEGADNQAKAVQSIIAGHTLPPALANALGVRIEQLNNLEKTAASLLENARTLAREGDLTAAQTLLKSILAREDLRATPSRALVDPELVALEVKIARRKELERQLKEVITRGDLGAGTALAREMGLRYLPLAIDSLPTGAEVWREGTQLGVTPLVLEMAAADRVDQTFELRVPGYQSRQVTGAMAEAGWRILVPLERQPAVNTSLKGPVTNQPAIVQDTLVTADRGYLRQLDGKGNLVTIAFADATVDLPIYAPASLADQSVVLTTRNRVGLKITGPTVERFPLAAGSDFPFVSYQSQLIVDRHYLVVAALDGKLQALDVQDPRTRWAGPGGAPFATAPVLAGDRFRTVRKDGTLEELTADDGQVSISRALGAEVVGAWADTNAPQGCLAGCTVSESWTWDGSVIQRESLPIPIQAAAPGIIISQTNRLWVGKAGKWTEVRRLDASATQPPMVWGEHQVVVHGKTVEVIGHRGFTVTFTAEVLAPVVWKDRLVLVAQDGTVRMYDE